MNNNRAPNHPASKFDFSRSRNYGYAEASDLLPNPVFGRVWQDACDVGFYVKDEHPAVPGVDPAVLGHRTLYTLLEEQQDSEGTTTAWLFVTDDAHGGRTIKVYND